MPLTDENRIETERGVKSLSKGVVTIHQPDFIPWLGFFDRMARSDHFIVLDDVQFIRRGWHNRDKIKTPNGAAWLAVPVKQRGKYHQLIKDVEVDNDQNWRKKHLHALKMAYSRAKNFAPCFDRIQEIYSGKQRFMIDINMELLRYMASEFGITTKVSFSSHIEVEDSASLKLVNLMKAVKGTVYLTGTGAKDYLDEAAFSRKGITVKWQEFSHPVYKQLHGEFIPMLSAMDFIFNCEKNLEDTFKGKK